VDITVGGHYKSLRTGEPYTVLGIEPDGIRIQWLDERGWEDLISRNEHLAVLKRLGAERKNEGRFMRMNRLVLDVSLDFCTLGYLARHGYLYCQMPVEYERTFVDDYSRLSNERPDEEHYNIKDPRDEEWIALSSYISFGASEELLEQLDFGEYEINPEHLGKEDNRWRLCNNKYFYALVSLGFRLGGEQSYERIMKNIMYSDDRKEFKRGFGLRG